MEVLEYSTPFYTWIPTIIISILGLIAVTIYFQLAALDMAYIFILPVVVIAAGSGIIYSGGSAEAQIEYDRSQFNSERAEQIESTYGVHLESYAIDYLQYPDIAPERNTEVRYGTLSDDFFPDEVVNDVYGVQLVWTDNMLKLMVVNEDTSLDEELPRLATAEAYDPDENVTILKLKDKEVAVKKWNPFD